MIVREKPWVESRKPNKKEMELSSHYNNLAAEYQDHKEAITDITLQTIDSCCNKIDTRLEHEG